MSDGKIMGLEPQKYVKISYILIIISAALGLLFSVLTIAGFFMGFGNIGALLGLAGLIMAVLGWLFFAKDFSALEINHLKYIVILFAIFFVGGFVLAPMLALLGPAAWILFLLVNIAQIVLILTGFNSYCHGRTITKETIQDEIKAMVSRS